MEEEQRTIIPIEESGGEVMVNGELWHEIHSRFKLRESKKSISRALGLSVQTVRKVLRQEKARPYERTAEKPSILKPYETYIGQRLAAVGYCAQSIFEELQERGYQGSYQTIKKYVHPLREEALREASVRFETPPGRQAQVDWGQCWTVLGGRRVKAHLFVMTLGFCRRIYASDMPDEKLPSFLQSHLEAFDHFGGCVQEILYDNAKTTVLSRDYEGRRILWNPTFWDFARYYGFQARAHRPYRPQTKGKVESGVKYVKRFLRGKSFESREHLNNALMAWIGRVADQRVHGTTHRLPAEMFEQERALLTDHRQKPPYVIQNRAVRQVAKDCLVTFETNRYSVPFRYAGRQVEVQPESDRVRFYHGGQLIGTHPRCPGSYQLLMDRAHYAGILDRPNAVDVAEEVQVRDLSFYKSLIEGGVQ